ncbi:MAG: putative 2-phosphosulfolactate phosphatase [Gemmatimonadota bacterium]
MRVHVFLTPGEVDPAVVQEATVVVVDVIRATTSMVEALANGARAIYPVASAEEAVRLATSLGREDTLLAGERKGLRVEGFDLGNSPAEFTREVVEGKRLVMSTSNGTVALAQVQDVPRVVVGAFTNLEAVAGAVAHDGALAVLCAGRLGRFALDDALFAGHLIRRLGTEVELNDAARAVHALAGAFPAGTEALTATDAGRAVIDIGFGPDLEVCGDVDRHAVVPEMRDQALVLAGG